MVVWWRALVLLFDFRRTCPMAGDDFDDQWHAKGLQESLELMRFSPDERSQVCFTQP